MSRLKDLLAERIPPLREEIRSLIAEHGEVTISEVSLAQIYGGTRGVKTLACETSALDPMEGIRFRGRSIPECVDQLPKAPGGSEPLPEGVLHLLLTGEMPSEEDVKSITATLRSREGLPPHVEKAIRALPPTTHPMTQFVVGINALQTESQFDRRYREGINRRDLWEPALEDALSLLANITHLAAFVYRRTYHDDQQISPAPSTVDWGGNFAHMLGFSDPQFAELMRLYLFLLCDHEGGNVSAHAGHLVGSALADPYRAFAAAMNGLAGPLHGLANQEVLRWMLAMKEEVGDDLTEDRVRQYVWGTLNAGRVIPGFGHAVLRQTDPRYASQRRFALQHLADDDMVKLTALMYDVVPQVLTEHGKAKNPWPNVDAHTGVLFLHYGLKEYDFYTVVFGVSRCLGIMSQYVWDRALGLPLERPKSVTTSWMRQQVDRLSSTKLA